MENALNSNSNYTIENEEFNNPHGVHAIFSYRKGIADRNTILATYSEDEYNFYDMDPQDGDYMIDAGGYVGSTAILYAQLYPNAKIICVEPIPENIALIKKNIAINHLEDRIILIEKALWRNSFENVIVHYRDNSKIGIAHKFVGSIFPNYHDSVAVAGAEVGTISIDDIISMYKIEKVRVLKMDIEGAEFEVLEGMTQNNHAKIQTMVGEYHNPHTRHMKEPRTELYKLVDKYFVNVSTSVEVETWGSFLFERR